MEVSCSNALKEKDVPFKSITHVHRKSNGGVVVVSVNAKRAAYRESCCLCATELGDQVGR